MVNKAFTVLTEFRFETGAAIAGSNTLAGAVDNVSAAADRALFSFKKLSLGVITNLTGGGGVLGILATAVQSSEKFLEVQVALANIMGKGSGTFATRMAVADDKMKSIVQKARAFGLPASALAGITKTLSPMLAPKMGPEKAIDTSMDLGRSFLKAAPTLGMDSFMAQDNLQRAVLGTIDAGDQLFMVLTQDTKAMAEFVGKADKFRKLPLVQRVQVLNNALGEFSSDMEVVERLANSVNGQFQILKDNLVGVGSVLKPLGDIVGRVLVQAMRRFNKFLQEDVSYAFYNLKDALDPFTRDLDSLIATFFQLRELSTDLNKAFKIMTGIGIMVGLHEILGKLNVKIPYVTKGLKSFADTIGIFEMGAGAGIAKAAQKTASGVSGLIGRSIAALVGLRMSGMLTKFAGAAGSLIRFLPKAYHYLNLITVWASRVLVPVAALIMAFQFLSRTAAHVKIIFGEKISKYMKTLVDIGTLFMRIFGTLNNGIDVLARLVAVSPIMDLFFWLLDGFVWLMDTGAKAVALFMATFQGFMFALFETAIQLKNLFTGAGFNGGAISGAFQGGIDEMLRELFPEIARKIDTGEGLVQQTVNMDVKMQNNFKEMLEPDRVAFTIKDQLLKAARNKTQAAGRGFEAAGANAGR